jgi:hypothetical protein
MNVSKRVFESLLELKMHAWNRHKSEESGGSKLHSPVLLSFLGFKCSTYQSLPCPVCVRPFGLNIHIAAATTFRSTQGNTT